MSVIIARVSDATYELRASDGSVITEYNQAAMAHPQDWIKDARDYGETVQGRYDWEYVDERY